MEIFLSAVGTLIVCYLLYRIDKGRDRSGVEPVAETKVEKSVFNAERDASAALEDGTSDCRSLCFELLHNLNCKVSTDPEDENELSFTYQGGNFIINVYDKFIRISFLFWYDVDLDDLDLMAKTRKIINDMNVNQPNPCVVYSINNEQGKMYVHSITRTLFVKEIPAVEDFLRSNLELHFYTRQTFAKMIDENELVGAREHS